MNLDENKINEGLAECMVMFRDDMIRAGVITEATPPMFMTEAILCAIQLAAIRWKPIETAPRDGTPVDLWHKSGFRQTDTWWDADDQCWSSVNDDSDFSHWMPTPQPPSTK